MTASVSIMMALNFSKYSKDKIFCHLMPSEEFSKSYCFEELSDNLTKIENQTKTENSTPPLISLRNATDKNGLEEKVWGCDFKDYFKLLKAVGDLNTITRRNISNVRNGKDSKISTDVKNNKDNKDSKESKDIKESKNSKDNKSITSRVIVDIIPLPKNVEYAADLFENMKINVEKMDKILVEQLGETIWNKLKPFQKECIRFCVSRTNSLIGDEMGLGKTIEALAIASVYRKQWPCLIICPSKCRNLWKNEAVNIFGINPDDIEIIGAGSDLKSPAKKSKKKKGKCAKKSSDSDEDDYDCDGSDGNSEINSDIKSENKKNGKDSKDAKNCSAPESKESKERKLITIISYQLVVNYESLLLQRDYKVVIVDESHSIKNYKSKRSIAVSNLIKKSKQATLLSGTACVKPSEIFTSINALYPKIFPDFFEFGQRYCSPQTKTIFAPGGKKMTITEYNGSSLPNELHIVLTAILMIRRTKADVNLSLPPKSRTHFTLNPDKKQIKKIEQHMSKVEATIGTIVVDEEMKKDYGKDNAFMSAYRKICKIKLPSCQRYVEEYITTKMQPGEKIILFAHHKHMMAGIESTIEENKIGFIKIDGSTDKKEVGNIVDIFQTNNECRIALLSLTAAGVGLTLTAARTVIFLELHPNTEYLIQAECRAYRIGQINPVHCIYLIMPNSIEEVIWQMTNKKFKTLSNIVDGRVERFKAERVIEDEEKDDSSDNNSDEDQNT